ncbi:cytochrome P450 2H1-like [Ixodes scapularis]|uniref:cytochrome P450 2H1-like n=1 Tax=Ixodes scapularis TaxID=6945 RepID=UPI001C394BFD|nr:cytochrome P450 2H1-like [Ixodes scapularis]
MEDPTPLSLVVASVVIAAVVLLTWFRSTKSRALKLPPGPKGLPILGHLPFLKNSLQYDRCAQWAKTYGPVLRIDAGIANVVVLNDFESIKKFLSQKEILYRAESWIVALIKGRGVANLNGQEWEENRRFCMHVLRDVGYGKRDIEERVREEALYLCEKIDAKKGSAFGIEDYLIPSISNNLCSLLFGRRYNFEDPRRIFLDVHLDSILKLLFSGSFFAFLPVWANKVVAMLPRTKANHVKVVSEELLDFIRQQAKEHEKTLDPGFNRDFIDGYLKKMEEEKDNLSFNMTFLEGNVLSFLVAGSNTVRVAIQWHLFNLAKNPDTVQMMIQREIDHVVGMDRQPCWEDRCKMPYTMATIWEIFRWRTNSPLGVPREAGEETYFGDYFIPKGTTVMPNLWAVHNSPELWKNPEVFDPSRFLKSDGSLVTKPEYLIPFTIGKRMCPGEIMATIEIFLYVTTLLQRFNIRPEEGRTISLSIQPTALNVFPEQKLRFVPRN